MTSSAAAATTLRAHFNAAVDEAPRQLTQERLMLPAWRITPRKQWPSGLESCAHLSGRIGDGPEPGRAIGRLTDLGWGRAPATPCSTNPTAKCRRMCAAALRCSPPGTGRPDGTAVLALDSIHIQSFIASWPVNWARLGRLVDLGGCGMRPATAGSAPTSAYRVAPLMDVVGALIRRRLLQRADRCCSSMMYRYRVTLTMAARV